MKPFHIMDHLGFKIMWGCFTLIQIVQMKHMLDLQFTIVDLKRRKQLLK
jgi:hypothetical protein